MYNQNQQQTPMSRSDSTDTIAMVIEIVFGVFGMMGLGWIYMGNFLVGIGLFIGWFVVVLIAILGPSLLTALTLGLGIFTYACWCCMPPLGIVVAIVSGLRLRDYVRNTRTQGNVLYLILAVVIGSVLICLAVTVPLFVLGGLAALQ